MRGNGFKPMAYSKNKRKWSSIFPFPQHKQVQKIIFLPFINHLDSYQLFKLQFLKPVYISFQSQKGLLSFIEEFFFFLYNMFVFPPTLQSLKECGEENEKIFTWSLTIRLHYIQLWPLRIIAHWRLPKIVKKKPKTASEIQIIPILSHT